MSKIPKFQQKQCQKILDKLYEKSISKPFQQNLSENFGLPEPIKVYLGNPIDLNKIRENLANDQYKTIQEWARDVFLVFDNALSLFQQGSPIFAIAKDLRYWFEKKLRNFPRTSNELWLIEFNSAHEKLQNLVDSYPKMKNNSNSATRYSIDEDEKSLSSQSSQSSHHHSKNENNSNNSKLSKPSSINKVSSVENYEQDDDLEDDSGQSDYYPSHKTTTTAFVVEDPRKKEEKKDFDTIQLFPDLD